MFFKFKGFYRQFSFFSLRLLNKKFLTTSSTATSFPVALTSSPSKNRRGFSLKSTWKSNNPELRNILQNELRMAYSQLQQKQSEQSKEKFKNYQMKLSNQTQSNVNKNLKHFDHSYNNKPDSVPTTENGLEFMFPLLTGEELKAFDSSVFE